MRPTPRTVSPSGVPARANAPALAQERGDDGDPGEKIKPTRLSHPKSPRAFPSAPRNVVEYPAKRPSLLSQIHSCQKASERDTAARAASEEEGHRGPRERDTSWRKYPRCASREEERQQQAPRARSRRAVEPLAEEPSPMPMPSHRAAPTAGLECTRRIRECDRAKKPAIIASSPACAARAPTKRPRLDEEQQRCAVRALAPLTGPHRHCRERGEQKRRLASALRVERERWGRDLPPSRAAAQ